MSRRLPTTSRPRVGCRPLGGPLILIAPLENGAGEHVVKDLIALACGSVRRGSNRGQDAVFAGGEAHEQRFNLVALELGVFREIVEAERQKEREWSARRDQLAAKVKTLCGD